LLQKPDLPTPRFDPDTAAAVEHQKEEKRADVFKPPYNPNLYVGELQDEEEGTEYVVLVSGGDLIAIMKPLPCLVVFRASLCKNNNTLCFFLPV
jgi:hypothetical protein